MRLNVIAVGRLLADKRAKYDDASPVKRSRRRPAPWGEPRAEAFQPLGRARCYGGHTCSVCATSLFSTYLAFPSNGYLSTWICPREIAISTSTKNSNAEVRRHLQKDLESKMAS